MFGTRVQLFRLLGIPIFLDTSWLIIFALLTLSLASGFPAMIQEEFPGAGGDLSTYDYWIMGLITALAFFGCIVLHELGHAVVARARGMPIRGITLFIFGGVAELGAEPVSAGTEFLVAVAGPAVSVVLAVTFWLLAALGYQGGWPHPVVVVCGYLGATNALVLGFNLIPAFPLDGGRVLRSILWALSGSVRTATRWASVVGQGFAWCLIALGLAQLFAGHWLDGIWLGMIGMFLNGAAQSSYRQVLVREALQGKPARHLMNPDPITVPLTLDLLHWVDDYVYRYHRRVFPVAADGQLQGIISTQDLQEIPRREWSEHTVSEVMSTDLENVTIDADADALTALSKMQQLGSSQLLVTEGERLVGIVSLRDLAQFLDLKLELESADKALSASRTGDSTRRSHVVRRDSSRMD